MNNIAKEKKHRILTAVIVLIIIIILGNISNSNNSESSSSNNATGTEQHSPVSSLSANFCDVQNLKTIIPDRIDCILCANLSSNECSKGIIFSGLQDGSCLPKGIRATGQTNYIWKDGIEMQFSGFNKGSRVGENINYMYDNGRLMYIRVPVSSDGTIGSKIQYEISLAIDPQDKTNEGYKIKQYTCCSDYCLNEIYKFLY